jgi:hypothetical protein
MGLAVPQIDEMFSDTDNASERASRFEGFKGALDASAAKTARGEVRFQPGADVLEKSQSAGAQLEAMIQASELNKSVGADVLASLRTELDAVKAAEADLVKDISLTSPLSTGLVAYDLEAPAKLLVPRPTPLRNRIARLPGIGKARQFKRITGISGSGTGGATVLSPFINDSSTISVGSLTLRRGPKISYAADEKTVNYKQLGLSDVVTWSAEFAGRGFQDMRQLSQTALLYASMLADERAILGGRGTDSGFVGAIATAGAPTATAVTATAGQTGNTANIANLFIVVTSLSMFGETVIGTNLNSTALSATTGKVLTLTWTDVAGAVGYNVYAGTVDGTTIATLYKVATSGWGGATINFTGTGTGGAPAAITNVFTGIGSGGPLTAVNPPAAGTSASADAFDGYLGVQLDSAQSGYLTRLNANLSTAGPGSEYQTAFAALFDAVKADPDRVVFNGFDRKQLSDAVIAGTTTPGYRLTIQQAEADGVRLGSMVTGIYNEVTGKYVEAEVHPWLPQGNSLILSDTLPIPDSSVGATVEYHLPQDYMAVNWPVIQHTYDVSSYWFGALCHYAPAWSGAICGIKKLPQ